MRGALFCLILSCAASKPQKAPADPAPATAAAVECSSDADCSVTHLAEGGCCPTCEPRVVSAAHATELKAKAAACARHCPMPACAPPRFHSVAACVQGRCQARAVRDSD